MNKVKASTIPIPKYKIVFPNLIVLKMLIKKISLRRIELLQFPYQENILPLNHKLTITFICYFINNIIYLSHQSY